MKLAPYPEYKESGVSWQEDPAHWDSCRTVLFSPKLKIKATQMSHYSQ